MNRRIRRLHGLVFHWNSVDTTTKAPEPPRAPVVPDEVQTLPTDTEVLADLRRANESAYFDNAAFMKRLTQRGTDAS